MPKDAISTVLNRNNFYRDGYRLLLRISLIQAAVIVVLVAGIVTMVIAMKPHPVFFATTSDGRIINIVPLDQAYLSDSQVLAWTAATAQNVMRFGYNDYRDRLQAASNSFTQTGWGSFQKALKDANFLDAIQARKQVVALDINAAPLITQHYVRGGVYTWYVRMPVTIRFDGETPLQPITTVLYLQIVRVSTLQNPDGISIEQWVQKSDDPKATP